MNKILLSLSIVAALAACKQGQQKNETETPLLLSPNTAYQNSSLTDTALNLNEQKQATQAPRIIEKTTIIYRNAPQKSPKSPKPVFESEPTATTNPSAPETKDSTQSGGTASVETGNTNGQLDAAQSGGTASTEAGNTNGQADETDEVAKEEKKGISKAAKAAIIGAVGGAVAGAVIGKNGKGAIIGGVIGAAGGYVLGRKQDKKDGRVN